MKPTEAGSKASSPTPTSHSPGCDLSSKVTAEVQSAAEAETGSGAVAGPQVKTNKEGVKNRLDYFLG